MKSEVINLDSRRNGCNEEIVQLLKENKNIEHALLLYSTEEGKLKMAKFGNVGDLETIGWMTYSAVKFMIESSDS